MNWWCFARGRFYSKHGGRVEEGAACFFRGHMWSHVASPDGVKQGLCDCQMIFVNANGSPSEPSAFPLLPGSAAGIDPTGYAAFASSASSASSACSGPAHSSPVLGQRRDDAARREAQLLLVEERLEECDGG